MKPAKLKLPSGHTLLYMQGDDAIIDADVCGDGACLFYAIALGFLHAPWQYKEVAEFNRRCNLLFGAGRFSFAALPANCSLAEAIERRPLKALINDTFRNRIVNNIAQNVDHPEYETFHEECIANDGSVERYLQRMRRSKSWGGNPEIVAAGRMLSAKIMIVKDAVEPVLFHDEALDTLSRIENVTLADITLNHTGGSHYHAIIGMSLNPQKASAPAAAAATVAPAAAVSHKKEPDIATEVPDVPVIPITEKSKAEDLSQQKSKPAVKKHSRAPKEKSMLAVGGFVGGGILIGVGVSVAVALLVGFPPAGIAALALAGLMLGIIAAVTYYFYPTSRSVPAPSKQRASSHVKLVN